jgi:flagella basal body P-ring formation protein FlgA
MDINRQITSRLNRCLLTGAACLWGALSAASPAPLQSHGSIQAAAESHVAEQMEVMDGSIQVDAGQLDARLRLSHCSEPLGTFSPPGRQQSARRTVGVRCEGDSPWTLYVPVSVEIIKSVVTASRQISKGDILTRADLELQEQDVARLRRGYYNSVDEVLGKKLKRRLRVGSILEPGQLIEPHAVKRGSNVTILADTAVIQVRMSGKAVSHGAVGDLIKVVNHSSNRQIEALVVAPGVVKVAM